MREFIKCQKFTEVKKGAVTTKKSHNAKEMY